MKTLQLIVLLAAPLLITSSITGQESSATDNTPDKAVDPSGTWRMEYDWENARIKDAFRIKLDGKDKVLGELIRNSDTVIKRTVGDFVERLFGGDPLPLLLHLADQSELKSEDVERLRALIKEKGR